MELKEFIYIVLDEEQAGVSICDGDDMRFSYKEEENRPVLKKLLHIKPAGRTQSEWIDVSNYGIWIEETKLIGGSKKNGF